MAVPAADGLVDFGTVILRVIGLSCNSLLPDNFTDCKGVVRAVGIAVLYMIADRLDDRLFILLLLDGDQFFFAVVLTSGCVRKNQVSFKCLHLVFT